MLVLVLTAVLVAALAVLLLAVRSLMRKSSRPHSHRLPKGGLVALSVRSCPGCGGTAHVFADVCRHCGAVLEVKPEVVNRTIVV